LQAPFVKDGKAMTRRLNKDVWFRDAKGNAKTLPGRAVSLVRTVGHHMFTDMVVTKEGRPIPEGFVDALITVAASIHDLRGTGTLINSRMGAIYIVKPKQHGSQEVALTNAIFGRVEEFFGLRRNTIKLGLMDEERRTSVNLRECIRAAVERVFFINTGFMDRTGDEIHTCMNGHAVVPKAEMRMQPWIKAYEDSNVDVGLFSGLPGKGQIGKGMWAKPDSMMNMLEAKISDPMSGASTAWVPSPAAAALHSIHYHRVDVAARQMQLAMRKPVKREAIMTPPFMKEIPDKEVVLHELKENAQSILGYVVRWIDLGVGCSKVPDLNNVGLMEDRATLRISSQLMANWLKHDLISEAEIRATFDEMARVVDQQNARDSAYRPMSGNFDTNVAYQAALQLVLDGTKAPNGYTEPTLHGARRKAKAAQRRNHLARL
jgi:malate synthase